MRERRMKISPDITPYFLSKAIGFVNVSSVKQGHMGYRFKISSISMKWAFLQTNSTPIVSDSLIRSIGVALSFLDMDFQFNDTITMQLYDKSFDHFPIINFPFPRTLWYWSLK